MPIDIAALKATRKQAIQAMRPGAGAALAEFARDLRRDNLDADGLAARARQARWPADLVRPADCRRRILRVGLQTATFRVRPGQRLVIQGCFEDTVSGSARLNGGFASGALALDIESWGPTLVIARVPQASGTYDQPVRVQLRFADGDFSNELQGQFVANRALYELVPTQYATRLVVNSTPEAACSWQPPRCPDADKGVIAAGGWGYDSFVGSHMLRGRHAQHRIVGYFATVLLGSSRFSNWGANGELVVVWGTGEDPSMSRAQLNVMSFDRIIVEAPVGTLGDARRFGAPAFSPLPTVRPR